MTRLTFASGATRDLPIEGTRVVGLDPEGRVLVNDFLEPSFDSTGAKRSDGWLFGLTLCCNASDKGAEHGIVCRACYGTADVGEYYYTSQYPSFVRVIADPLREFTS